MDESKRGYANLCSCRQLMPTYGRLRILRKSLFLMLTTPQYEKDMELHAGTNFASLVVFPT